MSEIVKLRTRAEIEEEAATWIWRMEAADGSADCAGFEGWLRQDPRHRRAVEELTQAWIALDGLAQIRTSLAITATSEPTATSVVGQRRRYAWLAAAALVLMALGGTTLLLYHRGETQTLSTAVGQHTDVALSDGTLLSLNTNTIVETNFTRRSRDIHLRKGEAHFEVAADRGRPFRVHAGDAVVRAIGTEFAVRVRPDRHVDVLVNEGRVEVAAEPAILPTQSAAVAAGSAIPVITVRAVSAGQQLSTATANYAVTPISSEQVSSQLAWRDGAVVFDSEPLSQAIAEIQRYTDARIVISDATIAALPVGGRFRTDDLQGFLDGLEAALPVTIHRTADGTVYIAPHH